MATVGTLAIRITANSIEFERRMEQVSKTLRRAEREFGRASRRMMQIGQQWTWGITTPIVTGIGAAAKAVTDWEDAFAGVIKTVDATEEELRHLDHRLRRLTERIPTTHREIAAIAETAGQLGIAAENIEAFTEVTAMLETATTLPAQEAAMALAQLDGIMQSGQRHFDRWGATIVHLGNNLATTETQIVDFSLRIAGAARIAGLAEANVLAIAGAFSSVGIEAEAGGTAVQKMLTAMTEAVATGDKRLRTFAAVAGMTVEDFRALWQRDAAGAFVAFVEGLGRSGNQAFAILRDLGLADQRLMRAFLSVAGAGDLLRRSVEMGNAAWEQNAALIEEAEKRYRTRASRLRMLQNRLRNAMIRFGEGLTPFLESLMGFVDRLVTGLGRLADAFERLPVPVRMVLANLALVVALIGPITWGFGAMNRALAGAIGVWGQFAEMVGKVVTQMRTAQVGLGRALLQVMGPTRLIIAAVIAAVVAAVWMLANWDRVRVGAQRVWSAISAAVMLAASIVVRGIELMTRAVAVLVPSMRATADGFAALARSMQQSAQQAWRAATRPATTQAGEWENRLRQAAQAGQQAADSQQEYADGIEAAGKAASKNIQSFDEVHTLQQEAAATPDFEIPEFPEIPTTMADVLGLPDAFGAVAETVEKAGQTLSNFWDGILDRFPIVRTAIEGVSQAVAWLRENWDKVGPVVEGVLGVALILMAPWLAVALAVAGVALLIWQNWDKIQPVLQRLWDNIKGVAIPIWERLKTTATQVFQDIWATVQVVWGWITTFWQNWGSTILAVLGGIWRQIGIIVETAIRIIGDVIGLVLAIIRGDWEAAWGYVKDIGAAVWDFIVRSWENIKQTAGAVWDTIRDRVIGVWEGIKTAARNVWTAIANGIISVINGIIRAVNRMIEALNRIQFEVPDWVPVLGGRSFGFNLRTISEIPLLGVANAAAGGAAGIAFMARGGTVTGSGLAVVGEAGPELLSLPRGASVTPLSGGGTVEDAVYRAVYAAFRDAARVERLQGGPSQDMQVVLEIDGQRIARALIPPLAREQQRTGFQLIPREA